MWPHMWDAVWHQMVPSQGDHRGLYLMHTCIGTHTKLAGLIWLRYGLEDL
jgi:hypothetical protein